MELVLIANIWGLLTEILFQMSGVGSLICIAVKHTTLWETIVENLCLENSLTLLLIWFGAIAWVKMNIGIFLPQTTIFSPSLTFDGLEGTIDETTFTRWAGQNVQTLEPVYLLPSLTMSRNVWPTHKSQSLLKWYSNNSYCLLSIYLVASIVVSVPREVFHWILLILWGVILIWWGTTENLSQSLESQF